MRVTDTKPDVQTGSLLAELAWGSVATILIIFLGGLVTRTEEIAWFVILIGFLPVFVSPLILLKIGKSHIAPYVFVLGFWLYMTFQIIQSTSGNFALLLAYYYLPIVAGGLLFGTRGAVILALMSIAAGTIFVYLQATHWPFQPMYAHNAVRAMISLGATVLLMTYYTVVAVGRISKSLQLAQKELEAHKRSESELVQQKALLSALAKASEVVSGSMVFEEVLDGIIEQISSTIPGDCYNIMLIEGNTVRVVRAWGYEKFGLAEQVANKSFDLISTPNLLHIRNTAQVVSLGHTTNAPNWKAIEGYEWQKSYLGVPIAIKGTVVGVLNVDSATAEQYKPEHIESLRAFAAQIAVYAENVNLFSQVKKYSEDLQDAHVETALALAKTLGMRDAYTADHGRHMARRSQETLMRLGGTEQEVHLIGLAAQLHDIGKIGIPDSVLRKPGPLTENEWRVMRKHPEVGAEIISRVKGLEEILDIIRGHHERYDGTGYPDGLAGEQIPLGARVITVADSYGAMTEDRIYRKAPGHQFAVEELIKLSGSQFDPKVVDAFLSLYNS